MMVSCARCAMPATQLLALSNAEQANPHWQTATRELIMAAEHVGILMLAEIAMRKALTHGRPKPASAPRKKAAKK
jgi:hypothetical protein